MSIAQRSVAGEGQAHPQITPPIETDSAALVAFQCDTTNLPWVVFRAAFRASHVEGLPQRARALLSALARTVDAQRPYASIFARRELLTGRAMVSMRTLYRSLDDLESAGLIERKTQTRYVEAGLFGRAYLHLTERAAALLGFVQPQAASQQFTAQEQAEPASSAANWISTDAPKTETAGSSFNSPCANLADGAIYKDLSPASIQKRQSGEVPADLQRLKALGFSDFLIFKLMRIARENGKFLSDVVEVVWEHLKSARTPINYLGALLRSPVDFGHQLRLKQAARVETQQRITLANQSDAAAKEHAGQVFESADGHMRYSIDSTGEHMTVRSIDEGVERQATHWKEGFVQALTAGRIRRVANAVAQPVVTFDEKPAVTEAIRSHISGLRSLLRMRTQVQAP
ncbi:Replication protein O [Paraburkholderia sp. HD33-4]|uniref:Replication protein O n=1 Tax=Paraburkholderia sp. HD33-4 TaxID=2883242 RepID=UPI001F344C87|nr:Replication protein O [Paraburkholderia sp. HD33-4]